MRERRHSIFFWAEGDQHVLWYMLLTSPVCHFDTSPLNAEATENTVTSNKREKNKKSHKKQHGWKCKKNKKGNLELKRQSSSQHIPKKESDGLRKERKER